jgi:cytoskeletal protein CcmA (bactofilin family)
MALKGFIARGERGVETAPKPPRSMLAEEAVPRTVSPSTSVDATTEFEGTLRCKETLRIDGRIKGEVECEKAVLVGEGARVHANIAAHEVLVAGTIKGDITARCKITLEKTAVVTGDLITPGIVIEEGAKVKGRIVIGSDPAPVQDAKPAGEAKKALVPKKAPSDSPAPQAASTTA